MVRNFTDDDGSFDGDDGFDDDDGQMFNKSENSISSFSVPKKKLQSFVKSSKKARQKLQQSYFLSYKLSSVMKHRNKLHQSPI